MIYDPRQETANFMQQMRELENKQARGTVRTAQVRPHDVKPSTQKAIVVERSKKDHNLWEPFYSTYSEKEATKVLSSNPDYDFRIRE